MAGRGQIVVVGAGGHGRVVCEAVCAQGHYAMAGFVDDSCPVGERVSGFPVLGPISDLARLAERLELSHCVVAAGDNGLRARLVQQVELRCPELGWGTVVHPSAVVSPSARLDSGAVILAGVLVGTGAVIRRHCLVNTGAQLDHDSCMDEFSSLAPQAATGGNVRIGRQTAIGLGAKLIHGVEVGQWSVVGAGAVVVRSIPELVVAYGVPCRVVSARQPNDPYL